MNNTKLIFYDYTELYEIFYELKQFLKFELSNIENKEDLNIEAKKIDNYLIISKKIHPNLNNQLVIDLLPSSIIKIVDKINIEILKNNFLKKSKISVGKYIINLNSKEITYKNKSLRLTEKEIKIIIYLNEKSEPITINELQREIWGYSVELETHTVETHVHRLKKKILDFNKDENFILSTKNGYKIG
tara:strand:+ start:148 stop:711 length:564 start_codon:yes stop_codon:yes gene_type:complete